MVYYRLDEFYANHRSFVKSKNQKQLRGQDVMTVDDIKGKCDPIITNTQVTENWSNDYPQDSSLNVEDVS
jgi:hypothetical protein